ncbi:hypothetical protein E2C01_075682 [Portunus trituberculatus]|uniref:Uncharacterized protein n=1 Tax=Portunus trituberculatus TaxID=210409 RepID=A0A5B7IBB7_PORTR|nr:hypothetical protein [Portunus trituberculatus]
MGTCERTHSGDQMRSRVLRVQEKRAGQGVQGARAAPRQASVLVTEKEREQASHWAELTGGHKTRQVSIQVISHGGQPPATRTRNSASVQRNEQIYEQEKKRTDKRVDALTSICVNKKKRANTHIWK